MEAVQQATQQESSVNEHYLDHVMKIAEEQDVEASEDIISGNGMKLLAKGARIDGRVKDRLLEHKLRKPLEECMRVSDGVGPEQITTAAEALLEKHSMLRALYTGRHKPLATLLQGYAKSVPMQSLLTVYAKHREHKLEHAVGVALLTMGMAKQLTTTYDDDKPRIMLMAGLFHDIGELYIAPAFLARGVRLTPDQWRHIAAHPIVSHRVLKDMQGMGRAVGQLVLNHHERLDGYGYPHGLIGDKIPLDSQILAVAEMLSGLMEAGRAPLTHADVALKLIPGEFNRGVIDLISRARQACESEEAGAAQLPPLQESLPRVRRVAGVTDRLDRAEATLQAELQAASENFKRLFAQAVQRLRAILRAFSSTGLDTHDPEELLQRLATLGDPQVTLELQLILKEIIWRLKELQRELTLRVQILAPKDLPLLEKLVDLMKEPKVQA